MTVYRGPEWEGSWRARSQARIYNSSTLRSILLCSSIWRLSEILSISLEFPAFSGPISIQGSCSYSLMTFIIPSIWTSILTLTGVFAMHFFHLPVQARSSDGKFPKVSECVCMWFSYITGFCPQGMFNSCCYGENKAQDQPCSSLCQGGVVFPSPSSCPTLMQRF